MPPLMVALLAAPDAPGARDALARAATRTREGAVSVILAGEGLAWIAEPVLEALSREPDAEVVLCSRSAREAGHALETLPSWIRPSSLVAWLRALEGRCDFWSVLP